MTSSTLKTSKTNRLFLGLLLCSFSLLTHAAQPEAIQLDLFSVKLTHSDNKQLDSFQLSTAVANTTTSNFVFGKIPHLPTIAEIKNGTFWTTSIRWHLTEEGNQASLSPRFRIESKESRIELNPVKRTFLMTWRRAL